MRTVWLELARRDPKSFSTKSDLYLCEDHFNQNGCLGYVEALGHSKLGPLDDVTSGPPSDRKPWACTVRAAYGKNELWSSRYSIDIYSPQVVVCTIWRRVAMYKRLCDSFLTRFDGAVYYDFLAKISRQTGYIPMRVQQQPRLRAVEGGRFEEHRRRNQRRIVSHYLIRPVEVRLATFGPPYPVEHDGFAAPHGEHTTGTPRRGGIVPPAPAERHNRSLIFGGKSLKLLVRIRRKGLTPRDFSPGPGIFYRVKRVRLTSSRGHASAGI
ncbi:hypothetical protein EVAR_17986_1 [Eumeta japonica]|uniref:THAP-type domain-containing protein n=1 Tax=Eumeta variegata TaxID=151549 RepID=A0A4C1Y764_EUMVA|nr:hypothetical protein EVAR_17986_1 [Eumeta japonica]